MVLVEKNRFGILIHGRHLQSTGWNEMMWGIPRKGMLGTIPATVLAMLDRGIDEIQRIVIGSGASFNEFGLVESEVIKQFILDHFNEMNDFQIIREHFAWDNETKEKMRRLLEGAIADTDSQSTTDEIAFAAQAFKAEHINRVIEVTGASHGPRCQLMQGIARENGTIPPYQRWQLITDDVPYANTKVGDTLVLEEPHRPDDPAISLPDGLKAPDVFRRYFLIPSEGRLKYLREISELSDKY